VILHIMVLLIVLFNYSTSHFEPPFCQDRLDKRGMSIHGLKSVTINSMVNSMATHELLT
jgi:hypothetical protein